ncbi:alternative oxidase [Colletotrichum zoysiae]|uniref:Alternative oxidase n=1 Tax=Colletotrichum zoysiae TaxID=1216348 RepID=A0AAD9LV74_9PEZI|nr:alternative oxidase [Colletotrichum zoysiae]
MLSSRASARLCAPKQAAQFARAAALHNMISSSSSSFVGYYHSATGLRISAVASPQPGSGRGRSFSTTSVTRLKDFFPAKETEHIRTTAPAWPHPGYTEQQMHDIVPDHREPRTVSDWAAWKFVRLARWCMDRATGLGKEQQVDKKNPTTSLIADKPLTESQWLVRFIFLESIAGGKAWNFPPLPSPPFPKLSVRQYTDPPSVPGMVAGMLRHLGSLRRMRRDNGWIETLLEESFNERMHLLTFMKMSEPGWFMKLMIIGAQGVFFNGMFLSYLVAPKVTHRFVGYLEEEAVHTYTRCLYEIDQGLLPKWSDPNFVIPDIAVQYWKIPEGHRTMKDLILYIRADEAVHRGVNHTLGNLNQKEDPNPFVSEYKDGHKPNAALRAQGFEREDVI